MLLFPLRAVKRFAPLIVASVAGFMSASVSAGTPETAIKSVSGTFQPGGTIVYTIMLERISNGSQSDNPGDEFTDVLPATLDLVSATANTGTALASFSTNSVTWNGGLGGPVFPNPVIITITATIHAGTGGMVISNQGTHAYDVDNNGTNEAMILTDDADPQLPGSADPTSFLVMTSPVELQSFRID